MPIQDAFSRPPKVQMWWSTRYTRRWRRSMPFWILWIFRFLFSILPETATRIRAHLVVLCMRVQFCHLGVVKIANDHLRETQQYHGRNRTALPRMFRVTICALYRFRVSIVQEMCISGGLRVMQAVWLVHWVDYWSDLPIPRRYYRL